MALGVPLDVGEEIREPSCRMRDLFLLAAEQLNIAPEHCLVIEDSVNGVKAGLAAAMTLFGFTGGGHADDEPRNEIGRGGCACCFRQPHGD